MSNLIHALSCLGLSQKDFEGFQSKAGTTFLEEGQISITREDLEEEVAKLNTVSAFYPREDENEVDMRCISPTMRQAYA